MNPLDQNHANQKAHSFFIEVVFKIMRICCLTRYDQEIFVETQPIQTYVYNIIKDGGADAATSDEVLMCLVLMTVLGIDLEDAGSFVTTLLAERFLIFLPLRNHARSIWIGTDYRRNTRCATLTEVLSGAGALLNNVSYTSNGIDFELTAHASKLKLCFIGLSEIILRSLYGVNHFPSNQKQLIAHLAIRNSVERSFGLKSFGLKSIGLIQNYVGQREVPVSIVSVTVWILQLVVLMLCAAFVDSLGEPFLPRVIRSVTRWLF